MLRIDTHPTELQLIIQEIEGIDNLIDDAQKFVTWNTQGKTKKYYYLYIFKCT